MSSKKKNRRKTRKSVSVAWDVETGSSNSDELVVYLSVKGKGN